MTDYCKKYIKVAYTVTGPRKALFSRLRCKQWECDFCAKKNASIWRAHLNERLPLVAADWWLVTITAHPHRRSAAASLANIRDNLERLFKRIKRVFGAIEYVRVYEKHPSSDAIHAHIIITGLSPFVQNGYSVKHKAMAIGVLNRRSRHGCWTVKTWFKKIAQEIEMGYMVDVQRIENEPGKAIWYVTKYLTKEQQALHVAFLRHVQVSAGIGGPKNESEDTWIMCSYITARTFEAGTHITDMNTGFIIDNNYWEHTGFYPSE